MEKNIIVESQEKRIARLQGEVTKREGHKKLAYSILKYGLAVGLVSLTMLMPKVLLHEAQQPTEEEIKMEQNIDDMFTTGVVGTAISAATVIAAGTVASKESDKLSKAKRELQFEYE